MLVLWQVSATILNKPLILPKFSSSLLRLFELSKTAFFWENTLHTIFRVFLSFFITGILGTILGLLSGKFSAFKQFLDFPIAVLRATPVVAIILVLLFAFSSSSVPIAVSILMSLPVMISAVSESFSFTQHDRNLFFMAKVFCLTKTQIFRTIFFPKLRPFLNSALISSFGMIWKVVAAGEVLSLPSHALGTMLSSAQVHLESEEVYALAISIVALSFLCEKCLKLALSLKFKQKAPLPKATAVRLSPRGTSGESKHGIKIENLNISFGETDIFKNFSLKIAPTEKIGIMAPSGRGKTTLLNEIAKRNIGKVSVVFQEPRLLEELSAIENVALPLKNHFSKKEALSLASFFLEKLSLGEKLFAEAKNLSGGEKQRVSIARAIAFQKDILLLDEPFNSLDEKNKDKILSFLREATKNRTVVLVSHDKSEIDRLCEKTLEI